MPVATVNENEQDRADLGPEAYYFASLRSGKFRIQRCNGCAKHVFFPRVVCPHCGGNSLAWVSSSGWGTVYSTTWMTRKPEQGGDYNIAIIRLDEGVQMMSRVDRLAPAEVAIGMRVRAAIRLEQDKPLLVFEPAERS